MSDRSRKQGQQTQPSDPLPGPTSAQTRRDFLHATGTGTAAAILAATSWPAVARAIEATQKSPPETLVKELYDSMSEEQRSKVCFAWDHVEEGRGLLRTRVANNWQITAQSINDEMYTSRQRDLFRAIFEGIVHPDWHARIDKQLEDDAGGWGDQSIAIFGKPGDGKFEFVMTGRHMTMRCDGNSAEHVAFGGPIFYGHAGENDEEEATHPGNVFWPQALAANKVFEMLDGKQRAIAKVAQTPRESAVAFRGKQGDFSGIPITELSSDQKQEMQKVLQTLLEPYRQSDRDEVIQCLKTQGGLDACHLAFYSDNDIGNDGVWDNWRLEGPSFVWYFRGSPHVHVWVNVADDAGVKLNA